MGKANWDKNEYTPEIKTNDTPIDMIASKLATLSQEEFIQWLTVHLTDLKQREINLLADAYYQGAYDVKEQIEILNFLSASEQYVVKKFKHLPTTEA